MSQARMVLATAAAEIGYSRWTDPKRGTKYARETQPVFWPRDTWLLANGIAFCDLFVTWVFWKALGEEFVRNQLPGGASYNTDHRASKGGRVHVSKAQPGDVLVFDWNWRTLATNHVGILEKVLPSGAFQTIEANTSPGAAGSQSNGGGVHRRTRARSTVRYVIRPRWQDPKPARLAVDGLIGPATVRRLQEWAGASVDGKARHGTWRAVQRRLGTPVDGVVSSQFRTARQVSPLGSITQGWEHVGRGAKGSTMVRALQRKTGAKTDGIWGPETTRRLQSWLNREAG